MERYPTEKGVAISPFELWLPNSQKRGTNNHHAHYTERKFAKTAATLALRNLERHQYQMPIDVHNWLHNNYEPPEMASQAQAAREVIDAYDQGEQFKIYDRYSRHYIYEDIPLDMVDGFIALHGLGRVIMDMAAD